MNLSHESVNAEVDTLFQTACKIAELLFEELYPHYPQEDDQQSKCTEFILHLVDSLNLSKELLVVATIYLDQLLASGIFETQAELPLLVFSACCLISSKVFSDEIFSNDVFAEVAGLETNELNGAERKVLEKLQFKMNVNEKTFKQYEAILCSS